MAYRRPVTPFVISTNEDFINERTFLAEKIYPQLDEICRERGTYFYPVDLRWDDASTQAQSGIILPLSLDLIKRCSPFSICLLGDRYGYHRQPDAPTLGDGHLFDGADWLERNLLLAAQNGDKWAINDGREYCSFTELEIIESAFFTDNEHCRFYFRLQDYLDTLFTDLPKRERAAELARFECESEYAGLKIRDLKQRIVKKCLSVKYFITLEELGLAVMEDWLEIINMLFPPLITDSVLGLSLEEELEFLAHESFAQTRRKCFVSLPETEKIIDELTEFALTCQADPSETELSLKPTTPLYGHGRRRKPIYLEKPSILLLTGSRGAGKSSVIATWMEEFRTEYPEICLLSHYVSSSPSSADMLTLMRRMIINLRKEFYLESAENDKKLSWGDSTDFIRVAEAFVAAMTSGPCVLVIDGLDEISGTCGLTHTEVKSLEWLPIPLPPQCKIIISLSSSDQAFRPLTERADTKTTRVPPLADQNETMLFMQEYLFNSGKILSPAHNRVIRQSRLSDWPLYLVALCRELRTVNVWLHRDLYIERYAELGSVRELWTRAMQRWTRDLSWNTDGLRVDPATPIPEVEFSGWLVDALRLIACARQGLTEVEVQTCLKLIGYVNESAVGQVDWAMFRNVTWDSLIERPGGMFQFFHQHLREAVEFSLVGTVSPLGRDLSVVTPVGHETWNNEKQKWHSLLAMFFTKQSDSPRKQQELPWQLYLSGDLASLHTFLTDPRYFLAMVREKNVDKNKELVNYWKGLENAGYSAVVAYEDMINSMKNTQKNADDCDEEEEELVGHDDADDEKEENENLMSVSPQPPPELSEVGIVNIQSDLSVIEERHSLEGSTISAGQNEQIGDAAFKTRTETENKAEVIPTADLLETSTDQQNVTDSATFSVQERAYLAFYAGQLLMDLKHEADGEKMWLRSHELLSKNYPLKEDGLILEINLEDMIGNLCLDRHQFEEAELWFTRGLHNANDILQLYDDSCKKSAVLETKGFLLNKLGYMKLQNSNDVEAIENLLTSAKTCMDEACSNKGKSAVLFNLALLRIKQANYQIAELSLREVLSSRQKWYGKSHPLVADALYELSRLKCDERNEEFYSWDQAEENYRQCLIIREQCLGKTHPDVAKTLFELGKLLKSSGSLTHKSEGKTLLRRSLDIRTTLLGPNHNLTKQTRKQLSELSQELKLGLYDYGPAKPADNRSKQFPFSSLTWHENELSELEQRSKSRKSQRHFAKEKYSVASSYIEYPSEDKASVDDKTQLEFGAGDFRQKSNSNNNNKSDAGSQLSLEKMAARSTQSSKDNKSRLLPNREAFEIKLKYPEEELVIDSARVSSARSRTGAEMRVAVPNPKHANPMFYSQILAGGGDGGYYFDNYAREIESVYAKTVDEAEESEPWAHVKPRVPSARFHREYRQTSSATTPRYRPHSAPNELFAKYQQRAK
ncbi:tetratricopeptide repeat protein 41-like [Tubulanus polymorphus]|uniref:tetratricopeptide repeat protein 41-like n=1 Tax=Tubulanus polymorphus TaxID=672921 RepID=UPI003DA1E87E